LGPREQHHGERDVARPGLGDQERGDRRVQDADQRGGGRQRDGRER